MNAFLKKINAPPSSGPVVCALRRASRRAATPPRMADLRPVELAHRFAGRSSVLGRGTYGVVTLMKHSVTGELYAVKTLDQEVVSSTNMDAQVELEISAQRAMDHVNVVKCWNVETDEARIFLIMDYCANGDLFQRLRECPLHLLPEREVFRLFIQLVAGVAHIHSLGFCHRDLKLENLLLDDADNLKIADFGWVARVNGLQRNWNFCGTLDYLAPEMVTGSGHDWRVDNWAVGILLYELSRGKPPFVSTAHADLLRRILSVDIHEAEDAHKVGCAPCAAQCVMPQCVLKCPVFEAFLQRRRLRGLAEDCLVAVKHFLQKEPSARCELAEILELAWTQRMLREEYGRYLRRLDAPPYAGPPLEEDTLTTDEGGQPTLSEEPEHGFVVESESTQDLEDMLEDAVPSVAPVSAAEAARVRVSLEPPVKSAFGKIFKASRSRGRTAAMPQRAVSLCAAQKGCDRIRAVSPVMQWRYTGSARHRPETTACESVPNRKVLSGASHRSWALGSSDGILSAEELSDIGRQPVTSASLWKLAPAPQTLKLRPLFPQS